MSSFNGTYSYAFYFACLFVYLFVLYTGSILLRGNFKYPSVHPYGPVNYLLFVSIVVQFVVAVLTVAVVFGQMMISVFFCFWFCFCFCFFLFMYSQGQTLRV